jgi:hypothetical protein
MTHKIKPLTLDDYFANHYKQDNNLDELDRTIFDINDKLRKNGVYSFCYGQKDADFYGAVADAFRLAGWNIVNFCDEKDKNTLYLTISCRWTGALLD